MDEILMKLIKGKKVTKRDICDALHDVCDTEHSSCNDNCPVYRLNENRIPNASETEWGCDCFKNGAAMLTFIRERI